jgi:hypothetical protein
VYDKVRAILLDTRARVQFGIFGFMGNLHELAGALGTHRGGCEAL